MSTKRTAQTEQSDTRLGSSSDQLVMRVLLFGMATSIIAFNVMGYRELFNEPSVLFGITPFGLLIGFAEVAVLYWTSSIIRNFPTVSRGLIYAIIPVVLGFWFLCFTGINSYLKHSTYDDVAESYAAKSRYEYNENLLTSIDTQIVRQESALLAARNERALDSNRLSQLQLEANDISEKMSQRRLGYAICDNNPDCAAAVADFKQQANNIQRQLDLLHMAIADKQQVISSYENELSALNKEKNKLATQNRDSINIYAQTESAFQVKTQTYENIVVYLYEFFGLSKPQDPFSIFIGFISFIIYPVYLLLNLYVGLNSKENCAAREERRGVRLEKKQHKAAIKAEIQNQKEALAREKRLSAHRQAIEDARYGLTKKEEMLNYLHSLINHNEQIRNLQNTTIVYSDGETKMELTNFDSVRKVSSTQKKPLTGKKVFAENKHFSEKSFAASTNGLKDTIEEGTVIESSNRESDGEAVKSSNATNTEEAQVASLHQSFADQKDEKKSFLSWFSSKNR